MKRFEVRFEDGSTLIVDSYREAVYYVATRENATFQSINTTDYYRQAVDDMFDDYDNDWEAFQ
tara:strand:- start:202 stop:390 length:189 start_codon:yes stop_codon:yes gene_type:complete